MRKYIRNALRAEAKRLGVKASTYVAEGYDRYAVNKYGKARRRINQAKGTHRRRTWRMRIASVV